MYNRWKVFNIFSKKFTNLKKQIKNKIINLFFLRRVRIFNKSKYSRNRQLARVIFYYTIYINIAVIFYIFYVIYGISFSFSWFWWLTFLLYLSFFISSSIRSNTNVNINF